MSLLTPAEVAEGARVSRSLIYAVLRQGKLPGLRIGATGRGRWMVEESEVEKWLESCKTEPPEDDDRPFRFLN